MKHLLIIAWFFFLFGNNFLDHKAEDTIGPFKSEMACNQVRTELGNTFQGNHLSICFER